MKAHFEMMAGYNAQTDGRPRGAAGDLLRQDGRTGRGAAPALDPIRLQREG